MFLGSVETGEYLVCDAAYFTACEKFVEKIDHIIINLNHRSAYMEYSDKLVNTISSALIIIRSEYVLSNDYAFERGFVFTFDKPMNVTQYQNHIDIGGHILYLK